MLIIDEIKAALKAAFFVADNRRSTAVRITCHGYRLENWLIV